MPGKVGGNDRGAEGKNPLLTDHGQPEHFAAAVILIFITH